jgi:SPP1 family predicted phage head-tail adaptor
MSGAGIDPGKLRHRLILEAPVETADGAGGVTRSYATVATLWAAVAPIGARALVEADSLAEAVTHRITIRARNGMTTRHRLREGTRVFRVVTLRDADGRGRFTEIIAQERVD